MPNAMWNNIMGVLRVKVPLTGGVFLCAGKTDTGQKK